MTATTTTTTRVTCIENVHATQGVDDDDMSEHIFPLTLGPAAAGPCAEPLDCQALIEYIQKHQDELEQKLTQHGAILFRGFDLPEAHHFDAVVNQGFQYEPLPYVGGAAPRTSVFGTVFTTNESPPDAVIPFHHEMAQVQQYPKRVFFFCDVPPTKGGETPLCRSDLAYTRIALEFPEFVANIEALGVIYTRTMPQKDDHESPIGRGWESTYQTTDKAQVEAACRALNVDWEWQENGDLKTMTAPLDAVKIHPITGKKVWFNSIVAAYVGWRDSRNDPTQAVRLGDGRPMDSTVIERCLSIMNELCVDIPWQKGDLYMIDNEAVMHARRTFHPPRKIYAALTK